MTGILTKKTKRGAFGHGDRHTQREDEVKTQGETSHKPRDAPDPQKPGVRPGSDGPSRPQKEPMP